MEKYGFARLIVNITFRQYAERYLADDPNNAMFIYGKTVFREKQ